MSEFDLQSFEKRQNDLRNTYGYVKIQRDYWNTKAKAGNYNWRNRAVREKIFWEISRVAEMEVIKK
jgi:hypothetical protein